MRSAWDWYTHCAGDVTEDDIRKIQSDAKRSGMLEAAKLCRELRQEKHLRASELHDKGNWDGASAATCKAIGAGNCARDIEAAAKEMESAPS